MALIAKMADLPGGASSSNHGRKVESVMTKLYECSTCGVMTVASEQVCSPRQVENKGVYCGVTPETGEMCDTMKEHLAYVCGSCGRPAEQAELLCQPLLTG